jgi:hypothetical protein
MVKAASLEYLHEARSSAAIGADGVFIGGHWGATGELTAVLKLGILSLMWSITLTVVFLATSTDAQGHTTVTQSLTRELLDGATYPNEQACEEKARWWMSPAADPAGAIKKAQCAQGTHLVPSQETQQIPAQGTKPAPAQGTQSVPAPGTQQAPQPQLPGHGPAFPTGSNRGPAYPK